MRKEFSTKTKALAFQRANGRCEECYARLSVGKYAFDHVNPDALTGEPSLHNCRVLCLVCHAVKTKSDVRRIAKAKRQEANHLGIRKASYRPIRSAPFAKREKRSKALTKVLPRRNPITREKVT